MRPFTYYNNNEQELTFQIMFIERYSQYLRQWVTCKYEIRLRNKW